MFDPFGDLHPSFESSGILAHADHFDPPSQAHLRDFTTTMRTIAAFLALSLLAVAIAGCGSRVAKPTTEETPGETAWRPPASPEAAIDSLDSFWIQQNIDGYGQLFAANFVFRRAPNDTGPWRQIHRDQELIAADALFNGALGRPAATSIEVHRMGLISGPDPRPGKLPPWHRWLTADYDVVVETPAGLHRISSRAVFFAVRGDSAIIPEELESPPDSTRWYLERWEEIGPVPGSPVGVWSWAHLKEVYLGPPPPPPVPGPR
jgi:hypothetical protein